MADTGFKSPTATGDDYDEWSTPTDAYSSDDNYAWDGGDNTSQDYYDFAFGVPAGATIDGIEIAIEGYCFEDDQAVIEVEMSWDGGANYTAAGTRNTWIATAESTKTYGGAASLFGRVWDDSEFSDANFRVRVEEILTDFVFAMDHIQVKVYYTEGAATYELTVTAGAGGSASDETGTSPYEENAVVDILATPDGGYGFNNWTTSDGGSFDDAEVADTNYNMPANIAEITANFTADPPPPPPTPVTTNFGGISKGHNFKAFPELSNPQMEKFYYQSPHKQITEDFIARVVKVTDGDTIRVNCDFRDFNFPVRLSNIQAPEMKEKGGKESQSWLENQILGKEVTVEMTEERIEKWGRLLANISLMGMSINQASVDNGHSIPWAEQENLWS